MKPHDDGDFARLPEDVMLAIDGLCNRFEKSWRSGNPVRVESLLRGLDPKYRRAGLSELLPLEIEYRSRTTQPVTLPELKKRFPSVQKEWLERQLTSASQQRAVAAVSPPGAEGLPGVLGDYRILGRLGGGGMGAVYRAVHERMGRQVALKVLKPEIQNNENLRQRFEREVRAAARLSHPNIVTALDARSHEGLHFLVTELVEGSDLDLYVRQQGSLSIPQAVDVILQAATGLAYAHSQGVIHRDIKPANLLLSHQGVVKILDMGLARFESTEPGNQENDLTETGVVMGTAAYMPPEQARDTRQADARSDIYSLGCTLHFLLTGRPVYAGVSQVDTILSHVNQPVPSLRNVDPKIPAALDSLFQSMIAKAPSDRIQTAAEVVTHLQKLRERGLEQTDSAELRDLLSRMANVSLDPQAVPMPTELHFADDVQPKGSPRIASRGKRTHGRRSLMVGIGVLLSFAAIGWSLRHSGATRNGDGRDNDENVSRKEERPIAQDLLQLESAVPGQSQVPSRDRDAAAGSVQSENGRSANNPKASFAAKENNVRSGWRFDGQTSYLSCAGIVPEPGGAYTLEVIARADRYQTSNLISWLGPDWMAIYVSETGQIGCARQIPSLPDVRSSGHVLPLTRWTHIAATFETNRMQLFIDGQPTDLQTVNFELGDAQGGLFVGGVDPALLPAGQNQRFFAGRIADARISRGVRYRQSFESPARLSSDDDTLITLSPGSDGRPVFRDNVGSQIPSEQFRTGNAE